MQEEFVTQEELFNIENKDNLIMLYQVQKYEDTNNAIIKNIGKANMKSEMQIGDFNYHKYNFKIVMPLLDSKDLLENNLEILKFIIYEDKKEHNILRLIFETKEKININTELKGKLKLKFMNVNKDYSEIELIELHTYPDKDEIIYTMIEHFSLLEQTDLI
jgi:hypothetical protein